MNKSIEPEKKKSLIKAAIIYIIILSFYLFIFSESDFFSTCTGTQIWVVGNILIMLLVYLAMGERRKSPAIYLYYIVLMFLIYILASQLYDNCFEEQLSSLSSPLCSPLVPSFMYTALVGAAENQGATYVKEVYFTHDFKAHVTQS